MKFGLVSKKPPPSTQKQTQQQQQQQNDNSKPKLSEFCGDDEQPPQDYYVGGALLMGSAGAAHRPQPSTFFGKSGDVKAVEELLKNEQLLDAAVESRSADSSDDSESGDGCGVTSAAGDGPTRQKLDDITGGLVMLHRKKDGVKAGGGGGGGTGGTAQQSRYIDGLKLHTKRRALEQEIVYERVLKVKQDTEADTAPDEVFITGAYQEKLEERKAFEEVLKKQEVTHRAETVAQRVHTSAFHRNLALKLLEQRDVPVDTQEPNAAKVDSTAHNSGAVDTETAHSSGAVDTETAHSSGAVDTETAHSSGAVDTETAHSSGAVDTETAHSSGAVDTESAHSSGAVDTESAHSGGAQSSSEGVARVSVDVARGAQTLKGGPYGDAHLSAADVERQRAEEIAEKEFLEEAERLKAKQREQDRAAAAAQQQASRENAKERYLRRKRQTAT